MVANTVFNVRYLRNMVPAGYLRSTFPQLDISVRPANFCYLPLMISANPAWLERDFAPLH
jgi:hypothetical protein